MLRFVKIFLPFVIILISNTSFAGPSYRGFQIGIDNLTDQEIIELRTVWKANLVRIQVGNNSLMDGLTGEDYLEMINNSLAEIDLLLPKLATESIKVVITLYSPPGGFLTRETPAHYAMFSDINLQNNFISIWEDLATRYKDNPTILAYDLVNEPALRKSLKSTDSLTWPQLIKQTISAIRNIDPAKQIIVKSIYGNPNKLRALPKLNDPNFCYSFHAYPDSRYINQGIFDTPINRLPPRRTLILKNTILPIQKLLNKFPLNKRKNICFNVGEFAVVRWAPSADIYLTRLLKILERAKIPATSNTPSQKINLNSWTFHAYDEAHVWDPRRSNLPTSTDFSTELTPHAQVLQSFMNRNP